MTAVIKKIDELKDTNVAQLKGIDNIKWFRFSDYHAETQKVPFYLKGLCNEDKDIIDISFQCLFDDHGFRKGTIFNEINTLIFCLIL